ncbi:MAG: Asp-tRNA(Asn)/Glu-tRNA(Gln) amidotransferase subunit GatC [Oscillospiraceae bacterium]|nr:Asp-tRNA(Asn)/Glu-tRNA(Gln) amidotransferase subunit GatC [Oscillospiraceae bacterium]
MQINADLIAYLEDLSCLNFADSEKAQLGRDLEKILANMARLGELDTGNVAEQSHPFDNVNAFREDVAKPSLERELILQNAPNRDGETFIAPKIL